MFFHSPRQYNGFTELFVLETSDFIFSPKLQNNLRKSIVHTLMLFSYVDFCRYDMNSICRLLYTFRKNFYFTILNPVRFFFSTNALPTRTNLSFISPTNQPTIHIFVNKDHFNISQRQENVLYSSNIIILKYINYIDIYIFYIT